MWCATLLALAVAARSWLFGLAGWWAAGALLLLLAVYALGLRFSSWGMFADVLTRAPQRDPGVALTFEIERVDADGEIDALLEVLAEFGQRATFLIELREAQAEARGLRRVVTEGHQLGLCVGKGQLGCGFGSTHRLAARLNRQREQLQRAAGASLSVVRFAAKWVGSAAYRAADRCDLLVLGVSKPVRCGTAGAPRLLGGEVVAVHPRRDWHDEADIRALRQLCADLDRREVPTRLLSDWLEGS